jgi:hypothetical protein
MADYAANPTKAKQDQQIIDLRKRMLAVFLNRCRRMDEVRNDGVWWRFLDPNASWVGAHAISCYGIFYLFLLMVIERGFALLPHRIDSEVKYESPTS